MEAFDAVSPVASSTGPDDRAHIIVLGNVKGGSGKSTTAMHIVVSLLTLGHKVGAIDLDGRQKTLGRYIENRRATKERMGWNLAMPDMRVIAPSTMDTVEDALGDERGRFVEALETLVHENDFVVVDCPGADNMLSRLGHSFADTLITPMNDSFIDLDLLARVEPETHEILSPSWYAEMVWEQRKRRAITDNHKIDWVIMRNRLSNIDARNKRRMHAVLQKLAPRIKFRQARGFGERVIFREMFLRGLTMLDLKAEGVDVEMTMSHVAARQEVRALIAALNLPGVDPSSL